MEADFTLVPIGGLGNRINAICSAIVYCQQNKKSLKILWFKDHNLNCSIEELFSIDPHLKDVEIKDASFFDFIFRDNPRRRNFWIPKFFQKFLFDRRIYDDEVYQVVSSRVKLDFGLLDVYNHIFLVSYWRFWESPDMWTSLIFKPQINEQVDCVLKEISTDRFVGIHVRRTDHTYSIKESPIELFFEKMDAEITKYKNVVFYLASDSMEEKIKFKEKYGDRIVTFMQPTSRNNKKGIVDAFVEMVVLSKTDKIYASSKSSFSEVAHFFSNNEFEELIMKK